MTSADQVEAMLTRARLPLSPDDVARLQRIFPMIEQQLVELRALSHALRSGGPPIGDPGDAGGSTYTSNPHAAVQGLVLSPGLTLDPAAGGDTRGVPAARRPYDEVDSAAPEGGAGEFSLRLQQALWTRGAAGRPRLGVRIAGEPFAGYLPSANGRRSAPEQVAAGRPRTAEQPVPASRKCRPPLR